MLFWTVAYLQKIFQYIEKNAYMSRPMQFESILFKGQLYCYFTRVKYTVDSKMVSLTCLHIQKDDTAVAHWDAK